MSDSQKLSLDLIDEKEVASNLCEAEKREISQNYKIVTKQGAGGCSVVYDAWRISDGRHVAIKVLALPDSLDEAEAELTKKRFYREARILSSLQNDHSVHCYEYGVFNGAPCVVLEFVEGQQLDKFLREYGALPFEYAINMVNQVLEALEEAHSKGIIHHDIKPANIMVIQNSDPPVVRLIDFGIATLQEGALGEMMKTQLGVVRGTPSYMAPELFTGDVSASPETDLYAVGLVLLESITGSIPFSGASLVQIAFKQAHEPVVIPSLVPECLARIIRKCCEKTPDDRYHFARDLRNDLTAALPEALEQRAACEQAYLQQIKEGSSTGVNLPPTNVAAIAPANNNKTVKLGLIALAAILIIVAGVVLIVLSNNSSNNNNSIASANQQQADLQEQMMKKQAELNAEMLEKQAEMQKQLMQASEDARKQAEAAKAEAEAKLAEISAQMERDEAAAKAKAAEALAAAEASNDEAAKAAAERAAAEAKSAEEAAAKAKAAKPKKPVVKKPAEPETPPPPKPAPSRKNQDTTSIPLDLI